MAKRTKKARLPKELASSGALCLAFANTAATRRDNRYAGSPALLKPAGSTIDTYADLVAWGLKMGVLDPGEAEQLQRQASSSPDQAAAVLERALALRAELFAIFGALAAHQPPPTDAIDTLNGVLGATPPRRLVGNDGGFRWSPHGCGDEIDRVLWPVARSAADVLTSDDRSHVGQCLNEDCTWLFLDRAPRRIWCDSKICGNRDRGKRYYKRYGKYRPIF